LCDQGDSGTCDYLVSFDYIDSVEHPTSDINYIKGVIQARTNGGDCGIPCAVRVWPSSDTNNYSMVTVASNGTIQLKTQE